MQENGMVGYVKDGYSRVCQRGAQQGTAGYVKEGCSKVL